MLKPSVPILALTLVFAAFAHAEETTLATDADAADAVKAAFLDQINGAISRCEQRVHRKDRCCKGSAKDCVGVDKKTTAAMLSATANINASASAEGNFGAVSAAEQMGQLTDNVKDAGDAMVGACNALADSCKQTCDADYENLKASCPECEADMQNLRIAAGTCQSNYARRPSHPKPPVTRTNAESSASSLPSTSEQKPSAPYATTASSAIPGAGAQPVPLRLNPERRQYMATEKRAADSPYKIENDNSDWRKSLNSTRGHSADQTADVMSAFARATAESAEQPSRPSAMAPQSASINEGLGTAAPSAPAPNVTPQAPRGIVGMREGAVHKTGVSASAPMQTVAGGTLRPIAPAGKPAFARGAVGVASAGSFARSPSSGSGLIAPKPQLGFDDKNSERLYKSQDAGVAAGGGGGSRINAQSAQEQPQLADYLPNGRLGPSSTAIAGGTTTTNPQILSQGKDVWQNMSMRLQYFCKIGRLYDCK